MAQLEEGQDSVRGLSGAGQVIALAVALVTVVIGLIVTVNLAEREIKRVSKDRDNAWNLARLYHTEIHSLIDPKPIAEREGLVYHSDVDDK